MEMSRSGLTWVRFAPRLLRLRRAGFDDMVGRSIRSPLNTSNFDSVDGHGVQTIHVHIAQRIVIRVDVFVARPGHRVGSDPAALCIVLFTRREIVLVTDKLVWFPGEAVNVIRRALECITLAKGSKCQRFRKCSAGWTRLIANRPLPVGIAVALQSAAGINGLYAARQINRSCVLGL